MVTSITGFTDNELIEIKSIHLGEIDIIIIIKFVILKFKKLLYEKHEDLFCYYACSGLKWNKYCTGLWHL
jgi:hypothetical protein